MVEKDNDRKTLVELISSLQQGRHVCGDLGNGQVAYVFRREENGHIINIYGYCPDDPSSGILYDPCVLDDPQDHESLLYPDSAYEPVWSPCTIPSELMRQFLLRADAQEAWFRENRARIHLAFLKQRYKHSESHNPEQM
ncbi:hypothetical protein [Ktedonospora formicarum]|uniref:Uncharacterized protein n=1 Tax=Ktedonospora formicarum TaxID=2778364 RepID=A0A8J3I7Z7_9CHLR|nr:hypothetical protein [Ktedonospora formicarum]GHO48833.1 hypothetical protein KSX_69960 [Ktedonospora formicarum]